MSVAFLAFCAFFKTLPSCAKDTCARRVTARNAGMIRVSFMISSLWFLRSGVGIEAAVLKELSKIRRVYCDLCELLRFHSVGGSRGGAQHGFLNLAVWVDSIEAERRAVFGLTRRFQADSAAKKRGGPVTTGRIAVRRGIIRRGSRLIRVLTLRGVVRVASLWVALLFLVVFILLAGIVLLRLLLLRLRKRNCVARAGENSCEKYSPCARLFLHAATSVISNWPNLVLLRNSSFE